MALRVAVVVSQAPGLGGTPSAGHRSTATAYASAAASSATSRSPKRLAREATTQAHSSRWARVIASGGRVGQGVGPIAVERPDLDLAVARLGRPGSELERDVEVGRLDDPEAGEVLLGLDERAVGEDQLAPAAVGHGRVVRRGQPAAEDPLAVGPELVVERVDRAGRGVVDVVAGVTDDSEEVVHGFISCGCGSPWWAALHPHHELDCTDPTPAALFVQGVRVVNAQSSGISLVTLHR